MSLVNKVKEKLLGLVTGGKVGQLWASFALLGKGWGTYLTAVGLAALGAAGLLEQIQGHDLAWVLANWKELGASPAGLQIGLGLGFLFKRRAAGAVEAKLDELLEKKS